MGEFEFWTLILYIPFTSTESIYVFSYYHILQDCCQQVILNSTGFTRDHKEHVLGTYTRDSLVNNKPAFRKDAVGDSRIYLYVNLKGMWEVTNNQYTS